MTELAASLGCVYEECCDDDSSEDGVPYYAWWVRVPQAEHARRGENDIPVVVDRLRQYLDTQLPDLLEWEIVPDGEFTVDRAAGSALREAYDDLIAPFERALMPLRVDGADERCCHVGWRRGMIFWLIMPEGESSVGSASPVVQGAPVPGRGDFPLRVAVLPVPAQFPRGGGADAGARCDRLV
jgi:hypothetical protein